MKSRAFIADHRGGLDECLKTEKPIPMKTATILIKSGLYTFYGFDKRIQADRYLIKDLEHNYNLPSWINIYLDFK